MSNIDKKIAGALLFLLGIGMVYHSIQIIHGEIPYPTDCHSKRMLCELTNFVFAQGGYFAVGLIHLTFSLFISAGGYVLFIHDA